MKPERKIGKLNELERKIGKLNERALRGERLRLHSDDEEFRAHLEGIRSHLASGGTLIKEDNVVVIELIDAFTLPSRRGSVGGLSTDPITKAKQYVGLYIRQAKHDYRLQHPGRKRIGWQLNDALCRRAIELVERKFLELLGLIKSPPELKPIMDDNTDIRTYKIKPTPALLDDFAEHFPDAKQQMHAVWLVGAQGSSA